MQAIRNMREMSARFSECPAQFYKDSQVEQSFQLDEPFCQPFGNRRLMHCVKDASTTHLNDSQSPTDGHPSKSPADSDSDSLEHKSPTHAKGELIAWESCGRIPAQERADFFEFVACNVVFAAVAVGMVFARGRRLQARHARQLAARIGLIRGGVAGGSGGWRGGT